MKNFTTNFTRSKLIESSHSVKILVKNLNNKILVSSKNDNDYIYPRSSIKIFQAIPFIKSQAVLNYKLSYKTIALACSSHRGESYHVKELEKWIKKIRINKNSLQCGIHNPLNTSASEKLFRANTRANQLHNNCAGKHLAMITSCKQNNYNTSNYLDINHPHQIEIRKIFETFTNKKINKKNFGIDGCSAPQYSFMIKDIANMLMNLIRSYKGSFEYSREVKILIESILSNPKYIGGTDSLDTKIMSISNNIFCKGGAEGVFLFADHVKDLVGIIKIVDGNERAIPSIIYNLFKKLKIMNLKELRKFNEYYKSEIVNHANKIVGTISSNL